MKFSVAIITYNRKDDLIKTIEAYQKQTWADKEIVVVDNASEDGTDEMMMERFPDVKYFRLPDNFDIRSINLAVQLSEGDVIWRCDDDSFPESETAFEQAAEILQKYPKVGIVATEDVEMGRGGEIWKWHPFEVDRENVPEEGYPTFKFHGTGAAIRRELFEEIGGFWEFGFEETDFATRAILAGYEIKFYPNIRTLHFSSPGGRKNSNRWLAISKQLIRYNWKYYPFWRALLNTFVISFFQILYGVCRREDLSAIIEAFFLFPATVLRTARCERRPVSESELKKITMGYGIVKQYKDFVASVLPGKLSKKG